MSETKILNIWELITGYHRMAKRLGQTEDPRFDLCDYLIHNENKAPLGGGTEVKMLIEDGKWEFQIVNCYDDECYSEED